MDTQKPDDNLTPKPAEPSADLNEGESLEYSAPSSVITPQNPTNEVQQEVKVNAVAPNATVREARPYRLGVPWEKVNAYLLLFILVILISIGVVIFIFFKHRSSTASPGGNITQQKLSAQTLQELASNGVQVGDARQVLNIQSNSVFAGTVLVKGELQVAGGLKLGSGNLAIPDVTVGGTAVINQLQAKSLAVAGNTAVQGQLTVQQSLTVNGSGTFNGAVNTPQLTTGRLQLNGDLALTRHLVAGGPIPTRANGPALGGGGTSSLSGSDTAGTININTGGGAGAGCLATVNFTQAFSSTPHITITPVGAAAASFQYYINRSANNFSVCAATPAPSNQSFAFDYHVFD